MGSFIRILGRRFLGEVVRGACCVDVVEGFVVSMQWIQHGRDCRCRACATALSGLRHPAFGGRIFSYDT